MEFYNLNKILSYNCLLNLIIGGRGIGKTFSSKKYCLNNFLKKGKQSIYLRRRESELDSIDKDKFFNEELLSQVFDGYNMENSKTSKGGTTIIFTYNEDDKEHKIHINSRRVTIDGKIAFYLKSLSTAIKLKGSEYDNVDTILFDEFLIDENDKNLRYLPNEIEIFFNFLSSVFRLRPNGKVLLLANATNINNPYFNYLRFDYSKRGHKRFNYIKKYGTVIEFPPNKVFDIKKDNIDNYPLYKLMQDSKTFKSNTDNKFYIENTANICKVKGDKIKLYQVMMDNLSPVSLYAQGSIIYVDNSFDKNIPLFTFNKNLIEKDCIFLERSHYLSEAIRKKYYKNNIYYENLDLKFNFLDSIRNII